MQQVVYAANPVSGLIHVFRLEEGELVPLQEVQTGGEVQPWSSARTSAGSMPEYAPTFGC